TIYLKHFDFNEPVYLQDANKESITVFLSNNRTKKVTLKTIKIDETLNTKTFITVKEFFKKCKKDNSEFKIEKVENGEIFLRVAYFNDLSLFYKISFKTNTSSFILININKYKFYKTNYNIFEALTKTKLNIMSILITDGNEAISLKHFYREEENQQNQYDWIEKGMSISVFGEKKTRI
ncbi:MAG: hypothetical protein IKJ03_00210, partial [Mycoplasmataceae bacterium]|nr:hypothetical protein [Mycoplasmataceae bacterium]